MNRSDLVNKLKEKADLSKKDAAEVVDTFFDKISETLVKGERVLRLKIISRTWAEILKPANKLTYLPKNYLSSKSAKN